MAAKTQIANAVSAIFHFGIQDQVKELVKSKTGYQFGMFAEQDYRVLVSYWYSIARDIVRLQKVNTKPLQDAPQEGSLEANDTGVSSEIDLEQEQLLADAVLMLSAINRHLHSLEEKARKDKEQTGQKTEDGGRLRFQLNKYSFKEFKGYAPEFSEFLTELKQDAEAGTPWFDKIMAAEDTHFKALSETQAKAIIDKMFTPEEAVRVSERAWDTLIERADSFGQKLATFNRVQAQFNLSDKSEALTTAFAKECKDFRKTERDSKYWINRSLEPVELLRGSDGVLQLINSPEWMTHQARLDAAQAQAEAAAAEAETQRALALVAKTKSQMLLMDALDAQEEAENMLREQRAAMKSRLEARQAKEAARAATH